MTFSCILPVFNSFYFRASVITIPENKHQGKGVCLVHTFLTPCTWQQTAVHIMKGQEAENEAGTTAWAQLSEAYTPNDLLKARTHLLKVPQSPKMGTPLGD